MQVRLPFAIVALFAAFGGGAASSHLIEREARAQSAQMAAVYVPAEGLAFRALDGHIVARLSYDGRGGAFEVFDSRERPAGALRPGLAADAPRASAGLPALPAATVATVATVVSPPDLDLGY
jgi:hypothetical protein